MSLPRPNRIKHRVAAGETFGKLTTLQFGERAKTKVLVRCVCGLEKSVSIASLHYGNATSCGKCSKIKHGMAKTKINIVWLNMMHRCYNPKNQYYKDYGGRGIKVCDRWHDFTKFYEDMGDVPEGLTIDRINNDGDYEPTNCRWATMREQRANQRTTEK